MKYLIFLFVIFFTASTLKAQVVQETQVMSKGSQPAMTLIIPGSNVEFVASEWKEFTKNYGKPTRVKGSRESMIEAAQILDIGGVNKLNIYATAETVSDGSKAIVWMEMGSGFLNPGDFPKEYREAVKFLEDFGHKVQVDQIAADLAIQQKNLTKFQGSLTKLQTQNTNLQKVIEDAKAKIAEAELNITANLEEQAAAQKLIDDQKLMIDAIQKKLDETKAKKTN